VPETGIVGHGSCYAVSEGGAVGLVGGEALFDWWIGADDRWHRGSSEVAVRQDSGETGTAIETRLRIPSGDAVQRVAVVPDGGRAVALVEIENASPVPVAVAVTLEVPSGDVSVIDDSIVVDGHAVVRAGRPIARAFVATSANDLFAGTENGAAIPPRELEWPQQARFVAVVFPVPHSAVLRLSLALDGNPGVLSSPRDLPDFDAVARGWVAHFDGGAEILLPDDRLNRMVAAARRHLLVGSTMDMADPYWQLDVDPAVPAIAAMALQSWGHPDPAKELLLSASGADDLARHAARTVVEGAALLLAWAELLERRPDPELEAALAPWIEQAALGVMQRGGRLRRRGESVDQRAWRVVGLAAAGSMLTRGGNETLGGDIVDAMPALIADLCPQSGLVALALGGNRLGLANQSLLDVLSGVCDRDISSLAATAATADPVGALAYERRSQHPLLSALLLLAVRRAVVDEPGGTGGPVALLSAPDIAWSGAAIEGHRVPIAGGEVAFGVRWHGERPALLWDLDTTTVSPGVTCPAFDPSWSDQATRGEALLAATPGWRPGHGLMSPQVRRGRVVDPEDESGSLS
jgi:hypothetical protein